MIRVEHTPAVNPLIDEFGNVHYQSAEIARGGQGVVFRTTDADLAIKQPLDVSGSPDKNVNLRKRFRNVRLLPLPPRIPISLPLAILRDEPGYVMHLLAGMKAFSVFDLDGKTKKELEERKLELPSWLAGIPDKDIAMRLFYYAETGSTRRRLTALARCACILARLHGAGLVYGDISTNNAFIGEGPSGDVWLIDADNLRFELPNGGISVYTPGYGAPEVVQGADSSRPRSDCWAFAVMAFKMLALCHPFIGKKVLEPDADEVGWDAEPLAEGAPADLDEQAYAGYLPFVDDNEDDSNQAVGGLPRELVATPKLRLLFQETFNAGRPEPRRRPTMGFWALELAKAFDLSLECPECRMSYFAHDHENCPYCRATRPALLRAKTHRWEMLIPANTKEFGLPHRVFYPFSLVNGDKDMFHLSMTDQSITIAPVEGCESANCELRLGLGKDAKRVPLNKRVILPRREGIAGFQICRYQRGDLPVSFTFLPAVQ